MYNKKTLSKATAELDKAKAPKKPKDIITDPMGQWKYPGLPTRIPGNDITMEGVGYPVLGVANNGQRKIMLPGADYTFPGADYVDEYPQMQKGGTNKSKSGTITNVKQNPDGGRRVQVKTKDGKYYEKIIPKQTTFAEDVKSKRINPIPEYQYKKEIEALPGHSMKAGSTLKQSIPSKIADVIFNPFTAAGYAVRGQEIPDFMSTKIKNKTLGYYDNAGRWQSGRNPFDIVADISPIGWAHSASDIMRRAVNKPEELTSEDNLWDVANIATAGLTRIKPGFKLSKNTYVPANQYKFNMGLSNPTTINTQTVAKELLSNASGHGNFKNGGEFEQGGYVDQYLTEDEIDQYRKGGYIVEDISVPELNQAQKGKTVEISDPKEFAYRKKRYDDSLAVYNHGIKEKQLFENRIVNKHNLSKYLTTYTGKNYDNTLGDYTYHKQPDGSVIKFNQRGIEPIKEVHLLRLPKGKEMPILKDLSKTSNGYMVYKKPTQPVSLKKAEPKKEEVVKLESIIKTPTTKVAKVENKPANSYPVGYQPYSLYGKVLDPNVYGYAESLNGKPVQVAQFGDTYGYKAKMDTYKKSGKYPWIKQDGGMVVELTPEEIEDHIAQGYIVEDVKKPQMQSGGQLPYQIWEEKTGTPWAEAKKQGLTDGSYEQNIALAQKLVSGSAPVAAARPAFDNVKYDKIVNNMVNSGASLDELVAQQIGTREGLTKRYPDLFNKPAAEATAPAVKTNVKEPAKISKVTPGYMPWKAKAKAPKPKAKVEQPSHVIQDLRQRITPNIDQPRNGEKFIINKPKVKSKENYLENLKNFQSNFNAPNIIGAKGKQEPIANSPYANMDFSKAHDHPKLKLQSPKKEIIKPTPIPKFIPKPIVKPTPKPVIKSETEENVFDSIKNYTKNLFEGEQAEKKQPEEQPKVVKQDKEYATIDKLNTRLSSLDSTLQDAYYQYTNPKLSKEEKATATKNFKAKVAQRNQLINNINKQKENYAGGLDTWINNTSPVAAKAAQKWGLSDQVSYSSYKLPDLETHVEKEEKENEKFRTSKRIDEISPKGSASSRWQFRVAASNDEPMKVQTYGTRAERPEDLKIKARGTVLHFLDQSPDSGYMHENTKDYYRNLKPDAYVGVLEKQKDGSKAVKYVQKKDIPAKDLFKNTFLVRQEKFDNIDFDTKVEDDNFSGHTYWTKKGTKKPTIPISSGKDPNVYDYSSGQSVVYIFPYKGKTRYVHFAGSPNAIRKEGEDIKKLYRLKNNTLNIGIADAGSYSSSIKGDVTDKKLKDRNYGYFNRNSFTGAGMALVE